MKKFMCTVLSIGMLASCLGATACGRASSDESGTTTITVGTYDGGLGLGWLEDAADRFMTKHARTKFDNVNEGVTVKVRSADPGDELAKNSLDKDVYLTEAMNYFEMQSQGKLANISDIVLGENASLATYGEDKTIADKLNSQFKSFLTAKDGEYYAIPFYEGFHGFIYDADMFALKGWYFNENGSFTSTDKSTGVDGKAGTYDDGLPKTYAQFKQLLDKIRKDSVKPLIYSRETTDYFIKALASFWADYEGKDKMLLNWSFEGETDVISSFDGDGNPVITTTTIGETNIRDLQKQPGKYYALSFLKDVLMSNGGNYESATDFHAAQFGMLQSCLAGEMQPEPVAMVLDGSWFENEADIRDIFDEVQGYDDYSGDDYKKYRNLAFMPIPMVDDSAQTLEAGSKNENGTHKQTMVSANDSFCFINAGTSGAKLAAAKEFLKFLHTEAELCTFNLTTSVTRPYTYTVTETMREGMSYYGRTLLEMREASDIVYPYSSNQFYVRNASQYLLTASWKAEVGKQSAANPFNFLRVNEDVTARSYFEGLYLAN